MRPIPLLDTNVFSDVSTGKITPREWALLKKVRPRTGWPLSAITSMELLAGLHTVSEENFEKARAAIAIAHELSSGRVLKEPRALVCERLLRREFPDTQLHPEVLSNYLLVASRANSKREIIERKVFIRRHTRHVHRYGGFDPTIVGDLMSGPTGSKRWRIF
jgi:hypothetical protein